MKAIIIVVCLAFSMSTFAQTTKDGKDLQPNGKGWSKYPVQTRDAKDLVPTGKGWGHKVDNAPSRDGTITTDAAPCPNGICYHSGPVMGGTPNIYYIWYGNWANNPAVSLLQGLIFGLDGSGYEKINSTYFDGAGAHVTGRLHWGGATTDNYSHGAALDDAGIQSVVASHFNSFNGGKPDPNGVYFVVTSADVNETSGFCTQYCGWHSNATIDGVDVKFGFIGNPERCTSSCEMQTIGPNGAGGGDGMASLIAHETEEAISDPNGNAWYDKHGEENADKCAWTFGAEYTAANGAKYNMTLGGVKYLIQRNWENANGGLCKLTY